MGLTEIILLIAGCAVFAASFILPEKKRELDKSDIKLGEEQIKKLVEQEMQGAKDKISDMVDETITDGVEKTERSLDRLSNEKIMAVNEYSDTVLESIHTNHKEAMFLYDMLNSKQDSLKETVKEATKAESSVKEAVSEAEDSVEALDKAVTQAAVSAAAVDRAVAEQKALIAGAGSVEKQSMEYIGQTAMGEVALEEKAEAVTETAEADAGVKQTKPKRQTVKKPAKTAKAKAADTTEVDINFTSDNDSGKNNNEKILQLHKQGKSNMAIAKELGLGIGEVKLVIDLFEGM